MTVTFRPERIRAPRWRSFVISLAALSAPAVYLFVSAPTPLEARPREPATIPIRTVFSILELENDAARALWTEEIVHHGIARGLAFGERWRDPRVEAGPLPALFLRETARNLERTSLRLSLFLGSRYPINTANHFAGQQAHYFELLETSGAPQFFFEPATGLQTAMFADRAVVDGCVTCHNEHADSPKRDWTPRAIMGATTWMYPDEHVSSERAIEMIEGLRASIRGAYAKYLEKVATFARKPAIGERWPKDGYYLPSEQAFMSELARRTSTATLQGLLEPGWAEASATLEPVVDPPRAPVATITPPTLVVRSLRSTRLVVEQRGNRVMVTRVPAGGGVSLTAQPPLRVELGEPDGVEVEWRGAPLQVPRSDDKPTTTDEIELVIAPPPEKS